MEWISVKDRLPEIGQVVLITDGEDVNAGSRIYNSMYPYRFIQDDDSIEHNSDTDYMEINAYIENAVTHWMPLPQPPQQ